MFSLNSTVKSAIPKHKEHQEEILKVLSSFLIPVQDLTKGNRAGNNVKNQCLQ
jgi:hypothetical protein